MKLLSDAKTNAKTLKSVRLGTIGKILYLASHDQASAVLGRKVTVCPWAKANGCAKACLDFAGMGTTPSVRDSRLNKTLFYFNHPDRFMQQLQRELACQARYTKARGLSTKQSFVRLDGTSDLGLAEKLHEQYPELMFYDYTKDPMRIDRWLSKPKDVRRNYHLTFSLGTNNREQAIGFLRRGVNVAVVFEGYMPSKWERFKVVDGDTHDLCYLRPPGTVIGLSVKQIPNAKKLDGKEFLNAWKR